MIREARIRYALEAASGARVVNAIVVDELEVNHRIDAIESVGYEIVGVDMRERDVHTWMPLNEGWTEIGWDRDTDEYLEHEMDRAYGTEWR